MRALLINPPRFNELCANNPKIVEEERGINPPLGLLYIAAYLEKETSHEVEIIDAQVEGYTYEELAVALKRTTASVFGITVMTLTLIDVMKTVALIKSIHKDSIIVLGGPHVHLYPDQTIKLEGVDYLVLGEGERSFAHLLDALESNGDLTDITGLVFRQNGKIIHTGVPALISGLDALPFPARHLTPYRRYRSLLSKGEIVTTLFTSRGCPYRCRFCDRPHLGKVFRTRSPHNVVDEIEECIKLGIHEFLFYDDTFTVSIKRAKEISREIIRRKLDITFDIRTRVNTIDEELLDLLKRAGCAGIHYGVEAGNDRMLEVLQKDISVKQARLAFAVTKRKKIQTLAYFMIGSPSETLQDIHDTFRLQKELDPDYLHMTILTPFPGTNIYADALKQGIIKKDVWAEFAASPTAYFETPFWGEHFTKKELQQLLTEGYKRFYLRPTYITKRLFQIRSLHELFKKARAGLKVVKMKA